MQFYYGGQLPLRVMDEAEFWKQQEEEHTIVIRELVKGLEPKYVEELVNWENSLAETHSQVVRFMETAVRSNGSFSQDLYRDLFQLITYCLEQSNRFINFCNHLSKTSEPIKKNPTAQVVMRHIIDESEYFIGIAQTVLYQK